MAKLISSTNNEVFAHYIFMDNRFVMPTASGLPLTFALSGTFTPGAKGGLNFVPKMVCSMLKSVMDLLCHFNITRFFFLSLLHVTCCVCRRSCHSCLLLELSLWLRWEFTSRNLLFLLLRCTPACTTRADSMPKSPWTTTRLSSPSPPHRAKQGSSASGINETKYIYFLFHKWRNACGKIEIYFTVFFFETAIRCWLWVVARQQLSHTQKVKQAADLYSPESITALKNFIQTLMLTLLFFTSLWMERLSKLYTKESVIFKITDDSVCGTISSET